MVIIILGSILPTRQQLALLHHLPRLQAGTDPPRWQRLLQHAQLDAHAHEPPIDPIRVPQLHDFTCHHYISNSGHYSILKPISDRIISRRLQFGC